MEDENRKRFQQIQWTVVLNYWQSDKPHFITIPLVTAHDKKYLSLAEWSMHFLSML